MALHHLALSALLAFSWAEQPVRYNSIYPLPPTEELRVRLPPTLNSSSSSSSNDWIPAPTGFQYGHWWVTHSSNPDYQSLWNFQHDAYPPLPPDYPEVNTISGVIVNASAPPVVDLTSFNLPTSAGNTSVVHTAFGYDFPRPGVDWVFDFHGTGLFNTTGNTWELLGWGYDTTGAAFTLIYETAVPGGQPPGLDVECRTKGGPDPRTLQTLLEKLKCLGNPAVSALADQLTALPTDSRRDGQPPVACPQGCINNDGLA